jgi:transcriptional regulator with XRE-family HTH domain
MSISDQIKAAIRGSGKTLTQIAAESGVSDPILSRFLSEDPDTHRDIRLERTADKLAAYFGLELRPAVKKRGR